MLRLLRDVAIVWGVFKDSPELKAGRELRTTELALLEAETLAEQAHHHARMLRFRISRLESRQYLNDSVANRADKLLDRTRIQLMEADGYAEELAHKAAMLRERIGRLKPIVEKDNAEWATT